MEIRDMLKKVDHTKLQAFCTWEDIEKLCGLPYPERAATVLSKYLTDYTYEELLEELFEYIKSRYMVETEPKNDIREFLEKLKTKGVKMGIATATGEPALIALLEEFDMLHYFSAIYSTFTVGAAKTEPKVYDVVLEAIGTAKETTWVFEDALYSIKTLHRNGYRICAIEDYCERNQEKVKELASDEKYLIKNEFSEKYLVEALNSTGSVIN